MKSDKDAPSLFISALGALWTKKDVFDLLFAKMLPTPTNCTRYLYPELPAKCDIKDDTSNPGLFSL